MSNSAKTRWIVVMSLLAGCAMESDPEAEWRQAKPGIGPGVSLPELDSDDEAGSDSALGTEGTGGSTSTTGPADEGADTDEPPGPVSTIPAGHVGGGCSQSPEELTAQCESGAGPTPCVVSSGGPGGACTVYYCDQVLKIMHECDGMDESVTKYPVCSHPPLASCDPL